MKNIPQKNPPSFYNPSEDRPLREPHKPESVRGSKNNAGGGGANATPSEITVLERRVLAHERILQALIGHLADDDIEIIVQLKARFGCEHNLGEYEQDYVSTDHYGDHFIRSIEAEIRRRNQGR